MNLVPPPNSPTSSQFINITSDMSLFKMAIGQSPTPNDKNEQPKSYLLNNVNINVLLKSFNVTPVLVANSCNFLCTCKAHLPSVLYTKCVSFFCVSALALSICC